MEDFIEQFAEIVAEKIAAHLKEDAGTTSTSVTNAAQQQESQDSYTIEELCTRLKISKPTLARHRRQGFLHTSYYVGRSPRFTEEDIQNYLLKFNDRTN